MEFRREERIAILVLGLVSGLVISFGEFVTVTSTVIHIDYSNGALIFAVACVGMIISVFLHEWAHKAAGRSIGYFTHVTLYPVGLIIGTALSLFTFGFIKFFTPNTCDLEADTRARIYKHRKYENFRQEAFVAVAGIFVTALLATILHGLYITTNEPLFRMLMRGNVWLMVYSMIPFELINLLQLRVFQTIEQLPQCDGLYILHYSIYAYTFVAVSVLALALILFFTASVPLFIALIVGFLAMLWVWWKIFSA